MNFDTSGIGWYYKDLSKMSTMEINNIDVKG